MLHVAISLSFFLLGTADELAHLTSELVEGQADTRLLRGVVATLDVVEAVDGIDLVRLRVEELDSAVDGSAASLCRRAEPEVGGIALVELAQSHDKDVGGVVDGLAGLDDVRAALVLAVELDAEEARGTAQDLLDLAGVVNLTVVLDPVLLAELHARHVEVEFQQSWLLQQGRVASDEADTLGACGRDEVEVGIGREGTRLADGVGCGVIVLVGSGADVLDVAADGLVVAADGLVVALSRLGLLVTLFEGFFLLSEGFLLFLLCGGLAQNLHFLGCGTGWNGQRQHSEQQHSDNGVHRQPTSDR